MDKNIYIGELNETSHVEDRGSCWVAIDPSDCMTGLTSLA